jgi:multidrug efflux pump subunit AcrB
LVSLWRGGRVLDPARARHGFVYMDYSGVSLERISLGALIIALGLLLDDAMITIEMMVSQ